MASETVSAASLLARAEVAWAGGDGEAAMAFYGRAVDLAEADGDLQTRVAAVLGLARGQQYKLTPGPLPVRLHAAYDASTEPGPRAQLAAALARCWAYANEPVRARPFALEALDLADGLDDPPLVADALDAALASHWGPDDLARRRDWAVRLDEAAAYGGGRARRGGGVRGGRPRPPAGPALGADRRLGGARPDPHAPVHARARAPGRGVATGQVLRGQPSPPARAAAAAPRRRAHARGAGRGRGRGDRDPGRDVRPAQHARL